MDHNKRSHLSQTQIQYCSSQSSSSMADIWNPLLVTKELGQLHSPYSAVANIHSLSVISDQLHFILAAVLGCHPMVLTPPT